MALTTIRNPDSRVERILVRDGIGSTAAVARTNRLDGRTRVVAVRCRAGWRSVRRTRLTPETVERLRSEQVVEVLIRRGLRHGRLPLAWVRL